MTDGPLLRNGTRAFRDGPCTLIDYLIFISPTDADFKKQSLDAGFISQAKKKCLHLRHYWDAQRSWPRLPVSHYQQKVCTDTSILRQKTNGEEGQDDDLLLDAPHPTTTEVQPAAGEDTEMTVDEEGRPRFAPAKNIVWMLCKTTKCPTWVYIITIANPKQRMDQLELRQERFPYHLIACRPWKLVGLRFIPPWWSMFWDTLLFRSGLTVLQTSQATGPHECRFEVHSVLFHSVSGASWYYHRNLLPKLLLYFAILLEIIILTSSFSTGQESRCRVTHIETYDR